MVGAVVMKKYLLNRNYQIVAKGYSNRRAYALAKKVTRWDKYGDTDNVWLGEVKSKMDFAVDMRVLVKRRRDSGRLQPGYYCRIGYKHRNPKCGRSCNETGFDRESVCSVHKCGKWPD